MSDNNEENRPFDEEILKQALSESLQSESQSEPQPDPIDEEAVETEMPLFDDKQPEDAAEDTGLNRFDTEEELSYGDLVEAWQEQEEQDEDASEDEADFDEPEDIPIAQDSEEETPPPAPTPTNVMKQKQEGEQVNNPGFSRIVIGVVALCAIGFTASNWMTNQKVDELTKQLAGIENRLDTLSQKIGQPPVENNMEAEETKLRDQATLAQLTAGIMENREAIDALERSMAEAERQNNAKPAKPAASPAKAAAPVQQMREKEVRESAEKAPATAKPEAQAAPAKKSPGWTVVLMSLKNEAMADAELSGLLGKGIKAEKHTVMVHGDTFHQVRAGRFDSKEEATAYIKSTLSTLGYQDAWVSRD